MPVIILLFVWSNTVYSETVTLISGVKPGKSSPITVSTVDKVLYIDLEELALAMAWDIRSDNGDDERLRLDLPVHRLVFTVNNPFVLTDEKLWQYPQPVLVIDGHFYAPLAETALLLNDKYPGEVLWSSTDNSLRITPPVADLLGIRFTPDDTGTDVTIVCARKVKYRSETRKDGAVVLSFDGGTADRAKLNGGKGVGEVTNWAVDVTAKGTIITLFPDSNAVLGEVKSESTPPSVVIRFNWKPGKVTTTGRANPNSDDRIRQDRSAWALDLVVIDPGHGGKDPGAVGPTGVKESFVTLDIGHKLRGALERENIRVEMTRSKDIFVPLHERTKFANKVGGKLFVSIHCNAAKDRKAMGTETYFLSQSKNKRAMELAKFENSVISYEEDQGKYAGMSDDNLIVLTMAQGHFVRESEALADAIMKKVPGTLQLKNRGVDQAGFYVLVGASMPAVLFETAFISNPAEEAKLNDPKFRQQIADQLAESILKFIRSQ